MAAKPAMYAIKALVADPDATRYAFAQQKTMYDGKRIAPGDAIFVFASENERGSGLKFYRQATDKIVGIADGTARFLDGFF